MIVLNGVKFAKNNEEFNDSLFNSGGTCSGFYRVNKRSITLLDHNRIKIGVIGNGLVAKATKLASGKWWYSYAAPDLIGEYKNLSVKYKEINDIMNRYKL